MRLIADEVRLADATDPSAVAGVCDDVEIVVSALGAPVSPSGVGRRSFAEVDVRANLNLLAEARTAGTRRFVYVGVYTEPVCAQTAYVGAHARVEEALRSSGLEHGLVRTTGIFGALVELLPMARRVRVPGDRRRQRRHQPVLRARRRRSGVASRRGAGRDRDRARWA